ncbi:NFX1-type zinc finger-containing protein 1-like isoform X2 [Acropora millepora]|uniref:NFX1-type zinc finger-containing protein 1-like isoform X2 n=1 Tax=Acropora millepora TaxID=45264 RepID=UPI001CF22912|nr:NFX1-type zinc finger-containing protein 1-like isoform X2 [Acropora millepora]
MNTPGQAVKGKGREASFQRKGGHKAPPICGRKPLESKEKIAKKSDGEETSLQTAEKETKEPCEAAANEKPGNMNTPGQAVKGKGRGASLQRNRGHKAPPIRGRKPLESEEKIERESDGEETPLQTAGKETKEPRGAAANEKPGNMNTPGQAVKGSGRVASLQRDRGHKAPQPNCGRKPLDGRNQEQSLRRSDPMNSGSQQNTEGPSPGKDSVLDLQALKTKDDREVVQELNKKIAQLNIIIRSEQQQHNSDEFISDLICTLARACRVPQREKTANILATLKGSSLLRTKIPHLLDCFQEKSNHDLGEELIEYLIFLFTTYLTHLPSSYADLPYDQLKRVLDDSDLKGKEKLKKDLDSFKQDRDCVIKGERQKLSKPYINRAGEEPPNDFRKIPICPTSHDIETRERPFVRTNIIKGRYENAEHYLDVQFRLLREDFLGPLREGIQETIQDIPRQKRNQLGTKNYHRVKIVNKQFRSFGKVHHVKIDVSGLNTSKWVHRRLKNGSLVCLSRDNFKTMLFATVVERDEEKLKAGQIGIQFFEGQNVLEIEKRDCDYRMVEPASFFEAYRHVLKGLQELDESTLPFKKYLVECNKEVDPPQYLRRDDSQQQVCYDLSKALNVSPHYKATAVPVLQPKEWPPVKALPLNSSQLEALRTAITTEFCVIQGPPGTGKTYVGTIIVRCLLENRDIWDPRQNSPMLMVCYTNHALDQFLEKVLEFLPWRNIIRVGGGSKSKKLENCNLKNFTSRSDRLIYKKRDIRDRMEKHNRDIEDGNENLKKVRSRAHLLEFEDLEELMSSVHADQFYNATFPPSVASKSRSAENTFRLWLTDDKLLTSCNQSIQDEVISEKGECLGSENGDKGQKMNGEVLNYSDANEVSYDFSQENDQFPLYRQEQEGEKGDNDGEWHRVERRSAKTKNFKGHGANRKSYMRRKERNGDISTLKAALGDKKMMTTVEMMRIDNIWNLPQSDRLRLYLCWVETYCEHGKVEVHRSEQEYQQLCMEWEEVKFEQEEEIIRRATVVGMTTTGAAKYHSVLQNVSPKVVVIEEAAEVMEAHILTSLTHKTEHAILIGDHKQLRPKAAVHDLAQTYNLEVSLFERMVMNNMDCKRLSVQHRMRPEIAALTKRIYDHEIIDHESVKDFEKISGVCCNLFFIEHNNPERMVSGLQSYANDHEAEFMVALCRYLLRQGYKQSQITVLTMYIGQLLVLKERMPRDTCRELKICAVDNFQGEENDIILLSLVRSNKENNIGFLAESNRICVALSRARKGLYCIGNFNLLKRKSDLWKEICNHLEKTNGIGDSLQLTCKRHNNATSARRACDFNPLGGCNMPCGFRLECGHACVQQCHVSEHQQSQCLKPCPRQCPQEHPCSEKCHYPTNCPPCSHLITKIVPMCNHEQQIPCGIDPERFVCRMKCEKMLPCGHQCAKRCGEKCSQNCQVKVTKTLPCGHEKKLQCFQDPATFKNCQKVCNKILACEHPCSKKCSEQCRCEMEITITLPCEHTRRVLCRKKNEPIKCEKKCERKLECGHNCEGLCHEDCKLKKCNFEVCKELPCGHQQTLPCYQKAETVFCYAPCPRQLECGHKCPSVCGQPCQEVQCKETCPRKCMRGHSCKKICHGGSPCGNCVEMVEMAIPSCGHTIKKPCYFDPSSEVCKQPCDRVRVCGHPCKEICSENCETRPCMVPVLSTLPCNHLGTFACHENPDEAICDEIVEVPLPCEHKVSVQCSVATNGLPRVLCQVQIEKELPCKHKLMIPCFKNPKECICNEEVSIELPCGHKTSIPCIDATAESPRQICTVKEERTLPCGHKAALSCDKKTEEHCCDQKVQVTLTCGHKKDITCGTALKEHQSGICDTLVKRKLPCGHENMVECSLEIAKIRCKHPCERLLPCGHPCTKKCGEVCKQFKCMAKVSKDLKCGYHKISCYCGDDVSKLRCSEKCSKQLKCGHPCPGKCGEDCSQYRCEKMVKKNLSCPGNHSQEMACCKDPKLVKCQKRCQKDLDCGHRCPGNCTQPCEKLVCQKEIQKTHACGHHGKVKCFQFKTATCKAPCERRKKCGHVCRGVCGNPCSNYPCKYAVTKTLPCNHQITMPCSSSTDDVKCHGQCLEKLACGHRCPGKCTECCERGSHELCQSQCNRKLVCTHHCRAKCGMPCPPCSRKCGSRCPHDKCSKSCSELCNPCNRPCKWNCKHYQCTRTCAEECDRPRCDAPCPKKLPCSHPCIGLCGEDCPTLCAICQPEKLLSVAGYGQPTSTETTRYIQLRNCHHIFTVEEMDAMMQQDLGSDVQLMCCPKCSTPITFSFRYGNQVKKALKNMENVKNEIEKLKNETATLATNLYHRLRHRPSGIATKGRILLSMKSSPLDIPSLFTFKNHLIILHETEKARRSLKVVSVQATLELHPQMSKVLKTVADELEYITSSVESFHPGLTSLGEVYNDTRKYALFVSLLELHNEATKCVTSLSTNTTSLLKKATNDLILFLEGKDDALIIEELDNLAALLRREMGLGAPLIEKPTELQSFPGFAKGVWKLCEHYQVYFTRKVWRNGQEEIESSKRCTQCAA